MFFKLSEPTALIPRDGDSYVSGKRMLFPSPVSGRGSRTFSLVHVLVHLLSIILSIALLAEGLDHANSNAVQNDGAALVLSCILLIAGVVTVLWLSLSSTKPFENHGLVLAGLIWAFVGSFALKLYAFTSIGSTLSDDHSARVIGLLGFLSESLGISLILAAFVTGLAASIRPFDTDGKPIVNTGTYSSAP